MPQDIKTVKYGNHERKSFSKTREVLPLPNLIEVQKSSYKMFLDQGIREVFEDFSPHKRKGNTYGLIEPEN